MLISCALVFLATYAPLPTGVHVESSTPAQDAASPGERKSDDRAWILKNVRVLPADGPLEDPESARLQAVLVRDGLIEAIAWMDGDALDTNTRRIDGQGGFVSPGFVDAHGHLLRSKDGWDLASIRRSYIDCLRFGVLYVRSMRGEEGDPELRAKINGDLWLGPHLILGAPPLSSRNLEEAGAPADWLQEQKALGFDFVKCLSGLDGEELLAWTQASHRLELPWYGHAPQSGLAGALAGDMDGIEHISPFVRALRNGEDTFLESIRSLGNNKVSHSGSILYYERLAQRIPVDTLAQKPGMNLVPNTVRQDWRRELEELAPRKEAYAAMVDQYLSLQEQLVKAGIPVLVSPSAGPFILPGYSYQEEVALLRKGGMSPRQIWRSATHTAFEHTPLPEGTGPVRVGAKANFVLLASNPLENTEGMGLVLGVGLRGKWYSESELRKASKALVTQDSK